MASPGQSVDIIDTVAAAHARLLRDSTLQFRFSAVSAPAPPSWLLSLLKMLTKIWPAVSISLLILIGLLIALGLAMLVRAAWSRFRTPPTGRSLLARPGGPVGPPPPPAPWRARLEEADHLARQERFDEAAHVLLFRTIDDLESRRPHAVRRSFTSREIAALAELPPPARSAFAAIAQIVEKSRFGGRALDAATFASCRAAYQVFADPQSWTAEAQA